MVVSQGSFSFAGRLPRRGLCQGEGHGEQASGFPDATNLWNVTVPSILVSVRLQQLLGPIHDIIWRENSQFGKSKVP